MLVYGYDSFLLTGACAFGSYLDETTGKCTHCQVGTYKEDEDALNCTSCPTGTSTEDEGTTNATDCKGMNIICFNNVK